MEGGGGGGGGGGGRGRADGRDKIGEFNFFKKIVLEEESDYSALESIYHI